MISWQLSKAYYAEALYHYDSAVYRAQAVQVYDQYKADGRWHTFIQTLRQKDALDVSLRVLVVPGTLLYRYGHMVVLMPFMILYVALLVYYVQKSSGSWLLGLACTSFLFTFSFVFDVYWGIADYWKDNLSTWMFGASVLAFILADKLNDWKFVILSSTLLGFIVVQRTVNAVYAAFLFVPLVVWALCYQFRENGVREMVVRFFCIFGSVINLWRSNCYTAMAISLWLLFCRRTRLCRSCRDCKVFAAWHRNRCRYC